jgi:hypothetical protein
MVVAQIFYLVQHQQLISMADLKMIETGEGGDIVLSGNDLTMIGGLQNMPYIGTFGGNVAASTNGAKVDGELAVDYWGNNLLMPQDLAVQYNSDLERKLRNVAINSAGRIQLQRTVERDLSFMQKFATVSVVVILISVNRIQINITIKEPDNLQSNELVFIWDATEAELTFEIND